MDADCLRRDKQTHTKKIEFIEFLIYKTNERIEDKLIFLKRFFKEMHSNKICQLICN